MRRAFFIAVFFLHSPARMTAMAKTTGSPASFPALRLAIYLLLAALVFRFFDTLAAFLLTVYAAAILASALDVLLKRLPLERKLATALIGLGIFIVVAVGIWLLGSALMAQVRDVIANLPAIEAEVRNWLDSLERTTGLELTRLGSSLGGQIASIGAGGAVLGHARGAIHTMIIILAVIFGALFALASPNERLLNPLLRIVPARSRDTVRDAFRLLASRLVGWIQGQLLAMLSVGILATIAFHIIGVPYALLLGVVNGLLDFIPLVGPWIGGVPAVIIAAIADPMKGVWTALAVIVIQQIESALVTPLAMSSQAKLHPFVTAFALLLFGSLFGFMGVLLAVPLALLVWTAAELFWVERRVEDRGRNIEPVVEEA